MGADKDRETLPCNATYVVVCILMPFLNGNLMTLLYPSYTLYFDEMGWPLVNAGSAMTIGYAVRVALQQVMLRTGYWLAVPIAMLHLVFATLAVFESTTEWVVFVQIVAFVSMDTTCAIEGIIFDSFAASEVQARQGASTYLSVYTIAVSLSVAGGAIAFDFFSWRGVSAYHAICQGMVVLSLCIQPACRRSFMASFCPKRGVAPVAPEVAEAPRPLEADGADGVLFQQVLPGEAMVEATKEATEVKLPGATVAMELEDVNDDRINEEKLEPLGGIAEESNRGHLHPPSAMRSSHRSDGSQRRSRGSGFTSISEAGDDLQHVFGVNNALSGQIVGATGREAAPRDLLPEPKEALEEETKAQSKASIPKDVRLREMGVKFPAFLVFMCSVLNNFSYISEYATFAIYFRQVHNWNEATWAGLAQMAGDIMAAIAIKVLPALFTSSYDPENAGCLRRFFHQLTSQPYNLSFLLFTWILFNFGMMSPWLPLAIAAQVLMGCTFVYGMKWTTEMNLFYSLGDSKVFRRLQTQCRNGEAVGGGAAGVLSMWLYKLEPVAPFAFAGGVSCVIFLAYTAGFCARLGLAHDIETSEHKRALRRGIARVSLWNQ